MIVKFEGDFITVMELEDKHLADEPPGEFVNIFYLIQKNLIAATPEIFDDVMFEVLLDARTKLKDNIVIDFDISQLSLVLGLIGVEED